MAGRRLFLSIVALGVLGMGVVLLTHKGPPGIFYQAIPVTPPRSAETLEGVVTGEGHPVAGAAVLVEEAVAGGGRSGPVRTDAEGKFRLQWQPRATDRLSDLRFVVEAPGFLRTYAAVPGRRCPIDLAVPTASRGRVLTSACRPISGCSVWLAPALALECAAPVRTDAEGRFRASGLPDGRPLLVLCRAAGRATVVARDFAGGDPITLRLPPAQPLHLLLKDPSGRPVAGARVALSVPVALRAVAPATRSDASGQAVLEGASGRAGCAIDVDAKGHLPLRSVYVTPHETVTLTLWPERRVALTAWNRATTHGVTGLEFDVELRPKGDARAWWGDDLRDARREFPVRPGGRVGTYDLSLPRCRVLLRVSGDRYADATVDLPADRDRGGVALSPLRRPRSAVLRLRTRAQGGAAPRPLDLVLLDPDGEEFRVVSVGAQPVDVPVPPDREVEVGSVGAQDGFWAPAAKIKTPPQDTVREFSVGLLPAVAVTLHLLGPDGAPVQEGKATLVDLAHERAGHPLTVNIDAGSARLWARPMRHVRITAVGPPNTHPFVREMQVERKDVRISGRLLGAAGLAVSAAGPAGEPIPFARVRLWGPSQGGPPPLWQLPHECHLRADGTGSILGLDGGQAVVEIRAEGFHTQRLASVRLDEGRVTTLPRFALEPASSLRGRLVDSDGKPVAGVWVHTLAPSVARLEAPGGAMLDVYDLAGNGKWDATTAADGTFAVPDETPRAPVLAFQPIDRPDLCTFAVVPGNAPVTVPLKTQAVLDVPAGVEGVYRILPGGRAILVRTDPPLSLRPLPVELPAGKSSLYIRLVDHRWAALEVDLPAGQNCNLSPRFRR